MKKGGKLDTWLCWLICPPMVLMVLKQLELMVGYIGIYLACTTLYFLAKGSFLGGRAYVRYDNDQYAKQIKKIDAMNAANRAVRQPVAKPRKHTKTDLLQLARRELDEALWFASTEADPRLRQSISDTAKAKYRRRVKEIIIG